MRSTAMANPPSPSHRLALWLRAGRAALGHFSRPVRRLSWPRMRTALAILTLLAVGALVLPRFLENLPLFAPGLRRVAISRPGAGLAPEHQPRLAMRPTLGGPASQGGDRAVTSASPLTAAPGESEPASWGRRILRQATLKVELADVDQGLARLTETIERSGGYVADTETHTDTAGILSATITAYVPPARFGRTLTDLEGLGRATSRRIHGHDVSEEFVDLDARARNLNRHEGQLLSLMGKAQKVADLLSLENELARVRGEIERLSGRIRFLKAHTEMAVIHIRFVRTPSAASTDDGIARVWQQLRVAFREGWSAAFRVAAGLAVLGAKMSPLVIPLLGAWWLYRRWRRREPLGSPLTPAAGQSHNPLG